MKRLHTYWTTLPHRYAWWRLIALGLTSPLSFFTGGALTIPYLHTLPTTTTPSATTTVLLAVGLLLMLLGLLLIFCIPIGIYFDSQYLTATNAPWQPPPDRMLILSLATLGFAPATLTWGGYYLWRRHNHLNTP